MRYELESRLRAAFFAICAGTFPDFVVKFLGAASMGVALCDLKLQRRLVMSVNSRTDDLASAVRYALETTRATAICPFHENVIIRVGDDDAEKHAYLRACNIVKSDGTTWEREVLREFHRPWMPLWRARGETLSTGCGKR